MSCGAKNGDIIKGTLFLETLFNKDDHVPYFGNWSNCFNVAFICSKWMSNLINRSVYQVLINKPMLKPIMSACGIFKYAKAKVANAVVLTCIARNKLIC